jgi:hypothetical protein
MAPEGVAPFQQSPVGGYQHRVVGDSRCYDKAVGRIAMQAIKLAGETANFAV